MVLTPSSLKVHNYIHLHVGEVCLGAALSLGLRVRTNPALHPHVHLPCGQRPGLTFVTRLWSGSKSPTRALGGEHHSVSGRRPVRGSSLYLASPHAPCPHIAPECWRHRVRDEGKGAKLLSRHSPNTDSLGECDGVCCIYSTRAQ